MQGYADYTPIRTARAFTRQLTGNRSNGAMMVSPVTLANGSTGQSSTVLVPPAVNTASVLGRCSPTSQLGTTAPLSDTESTLEAAPERLLAFSSARMYTSSGRTVDVTRKGPRRPSTPFAVQAFAL
jgi:hypothetical protein